MNPTEEEMSERCRCGHTLGQHAYGAEYLHESCDHCATCTFFEPMHLWGDAYWLAEASAWLQESARG